MASTRRTITLHDSIVYNPNPDCNYELVSTLYPQFSISVTFEGVDCNRVALVDFGGMHYTIKGEENNQVICCEYPIVLVDPSGLPLFWFQAPNNFYAINSICFKYQIGNNIEVSFSACGEALKAETNNVSLKDQCIKLLKNTLVRVPDFPIMLPNEKPSSDFLHTLYRHFIAFNNDEKLKQQYENSNSYCHIRAHFVSALLKEYGIVSLKVFKCWNPNDWKALRKDDLTWVDHCAAGIIDSDNTIWIWDSWVNYHHKLLTLPEWVYQENEPRVTEVVIVNSIIVNNISKDKKNIYTPRYSLLQPYYLNPFQAVCSSAVPFSIHIQKHGLFKSNPERTLIPYYHNPFRVNQIQG